jgi:hypothetical protein
MNSTTETDPGLEALRGAAGLIEEVTDGAIRSKVSSSIVAMYLFVNQPRVSTMFVFGESEPFQSLHAYRDTPERNYGEKRRLHWLGPYSRDNRPVWTPEGVAGLVLATIGMWENRP